MAGLTVADRTHWRDRIAKRIDQRIETLVAKQDPTLLQRVEKDARERSLKSLGIDAQQKEIDQLHKQKEEMEQRERRLWAEQRAVIKGTTVREEMEHGTYYNPESEVEDAVRARARTMEDEILGESDLGRQVLALRAEKDNLLDTVWLATSTAQIKELWSHVNALLDLKPTALEDKALRIAPVQEE